MKKVVFITGITSFLGRNVAKKLIKNNFEVIGILRPESDIGLIKNIKGLKTITIDFNKINIEDFNDIEYEYRIKKNIDSINELNREIYFIHFGWGSTLNRSDFNSQMLNVDYSKKVYFISRLIKCKKFIFAGSQAEKANITAYGVAKNEFANFVKSLNDNSFIHLRIHSVYGLDDRRTTLILSIIDSIKNKKDIELTSLNYLWNFLYIDDFCEIIKEFLEKNVRTDLIYDIGSADTRLLKKYVEEMKDVLNAKINFNIGARPDSKEVFTVPNITNMMHILDTFNFTKFGDGIKYIYKHYK